MAKQSFKLIFQSNFGNYFVLVNIFLVNPGVSRDFFSRDRKVDSLIIKFSKFSFYEKIVFLNPFSCISTLSCYLVEYKHVLFG